MRVTVIDRVRCRAHTCSTGGLEVLGGAERILRDSISITRGVIVLSNSGSLRVLRGPFCHSLWRNPFPATRSRPRVPRPSAELHCGAKW
jgi:hypothetical protein